MSDVEAAARAYAAANATPEVSRETALTLAFIEGALFGINDLAARTFAKDAIAKAGSKAA